MTSLLFRAVRGIRQSPGLFVTTVLSVALCLVLVGAFSLAMQAARAWLKTVVGAESLVVYLRPELDEAAARVVADVISARQEVAALERESPEASAERMRSVLDDETRATVTGALSWSLQVRARAAGELQALAQTIAEIPGVDEVDYGADMYERLQAIERIVSLVSAALLGLVLAVCAYVVSITVSLALYVRRDEIQVQRIVGASDAFIIGPLLAEGVLSGLLGSSLSLALLTLGGLWASTRFASALASLGLRSAGDLPAALIVIQLALGVIICAIGALSATLRYLRQAQ